MGGPKLPARKQSMKKKFPRKLPSVTRRGLPKGLALALLSACLIIIWSPNTWFSQTLATADQYRLVPEYKRLMKRVLISLPIDRPTIALHLGYLRYLPEYTEILILLPKTSMEAVAEQLRQQPYSGRTRLISFDTEYLQAPRVFFSFAELDKLFELVEREADFGMVSPRGTIWAQDLFEVATTEDGETVALTSDVHKWFVAGDKENPLRISPDNSYLKHLSSVGVKVRRQPVTFAGGNILLDEFQGRRFAFVGNDVLRRTRTVWRSTRESIPTEDEIINMLKRFLRADDVVVVGRDKVQPSLMFHMDQAMIPLGEGIIAVTKVVGEPDEADENAGEIYKVKAFLRELEELLLNLGYGIVGIDTSVINVLNRQFYVNGIPYLDAVTGQKTLLMPVFPAMQTGLDERIVRKNTRTFESLGYRVVPIDSEAERLNGGLHCLINVLE